MSMRVTGCDRTLSFRSPRSQNVKSSFRFYRLKRFEKHSDFSLLKFILVDYLDSVATIKYRRICHINQSWHGGDKRPPPIFKIAPKIISHRFRVI